jgi:hypothetical protein
MKFFKKKKRKKNKRRKREERKKERKRKETCFFPLLWSRNHFSPTGSSSDISHSRKKGEEKG